MENILELHQISKTFPKSNFTLENLSLSLPYGAIMGFVGENGAGKTTTIGCILNTLRRDGGTVKLFGQEMQDVDTDLREKIGVVYDGDNFPGFWNARQLSRVMSGLYRQWDNALFQKYLEDFRLPVKQKIKSYSRGMTMKLAIAAALSHHPQLLILDEATSSVDTRTEQRIQKAMNNLMKGRTSFVIAHRLSTIKDADLILVMKDGDIIEQGSHEQLLAQKGFYAELYNSQFEDVAG